jgi:hypothetical protein
MCDEAVALLEQAHEASGYLNSYFNTVKTT